MGPSLCSSGLRDLSEEATLESIQSADNACSSMMWVDGDFRGTVVSVSLHLSGTLANEFHGQSWILKWHVLLFRGTPLKIFHIS